jgi:hypothetical protein
MRRLVVRWMVVRWMVVRWMRDRDYVGGNGIRRRLALWRSWAATAPRVAKLLLGFSLGGLVVDGAALVGALLVMVPPATDGAAQVQTPSVARVGEKPQSAMRAVSHKWQQFVIGGQDGVECGLILMDERFSAMILVPIGAKRENFLEGDDKKARFSVRMASDGFTPSSYLIGAQASRGQGEVFSCPWGKSEPASSATDPTRTNRPACRVDASSPPAPV